MLKYTSLLLLLVITLSTTSARAAAPNVVIIYADDVGYGDLSCYGTASIKTPEAGRMAREGLKFTSAYCTSATCTPSRYSLLTGEYAWRKKGTGVLPGDAAMIIEPGRETIASVMQRAGYKTGVVGKWHLGLGGENKDWNNAVTPGPGQIGFDYSFLIPATGDRVPCVYVENDHVVGLDSNDPIEVNYKQNFTGQPTGKANPELLTKMKWHHGHDMSIVNGISRIGFMKGGKSALWVDEDMADVITGKAVKFIEDNKAQPFFLYFATQDVHVPRVPHPRFVGKSGMGPRGDALLEFDWSIGQILDTLDRLKLSENTLVILSSDNGPVINDGYYDDAVEKLGDHKPAGPFRGGKYSKFEAGTRVPFLVRWPGHVPANQTSDALFSQVDLLASLAKLVGQPYNTATAPDTHNYLDTLLGKSETGRDYIIEHAGQLSIRKGDWKLIQPAQGPAVTANTNSETGNAQVTQLYDLKSSPWESENVASKHPDVVKELEAIIAAERAK